MLIKCTVLRLHTTRNINAKTSCEILFRSVIGDTPKQWIWKEGGPVCTSFIDFRDRTIHRKRKIKGQTELFKEEEQK